MPLSAGEVRRHLQGRQTIGIYTLLADESCWLVAIDLDGPSWRADAGAVRAVAVDAGIPVLVERSRSGQGAHVWVLFSRPIAASAGRTVGSWLLTQAMRRHEEPRLAAEDAIRRARQISRVRGVPGTNDEAQAG